jgi:hypothetical protein
MFLYYYPGLGPIPPELHYAIKQTDPHHRRHVMHGPLGRGEGQIIAHGDVDPNLVKIDEAFQSWKPFPGESKLCVGLTNGTKPDPQQLSRPMMLKGHWVTFEDGSNWLVPIARGFDTASEQMYLALPIGLEYECSTGRWIAGGVKARYKAFFDLVEQHVQLRIEKLAEQVDSYEDPNADQLAIVALQTNYRISAVELSFFDGAYSPDERQSVLNAIIDLPSIIDWNNKKKAQRDSMNTSAGPEQ